MSKKININGENHFCKSIKKYLNALLSICATLPNDEGYKKVNIKNSALMLALDITFYGERGYKSFLTLKHLVTCSKEGSYNSLSKSRVSDLYTINWYNICNFLIAYKHCTGKYLNIPAIEIFAASSRLPEDLRDFFERYYGEYSLLEEFENGEHYKMTLLDEIEEKDDGDSFFIEMSEAQLTKELQ